LLLVIAVMGWLGLALHVLVLVTIVATPGLSMQAAVLAKSQTTRGGVAQRRAAARALLVSRWR
jgi:hypothetical protein